MSSLCSTKTPLSHVGYVVIHVPFQTWLTYLSEDRSRRQISYNRRGTYGANNHICEAEDKSVTTGDALMVPTIIYVKQVLDLVAKGLVKGVAHITGGGFTDNIPRIFPEGLGAVVNANSWEVPSIFKWIQEAGDVKDAEMRKTFNMWIGMVLVVSPEAAEAILAEEGPRKVYRLGHVVKGEGITNK